MAEVVQHMKQEDENGCGIACIAMIKRKKYSSVKKKLNAKLCKHIGLMEGLTPAEMMLALEKSKITVKSYVRKDGLSWKEIEGLSIVGINWNETKEKFHWVVYCSEDNQILDPEYPKVRTADGRTKPFLALVVGESGKI